MVNKCRSCGDATLGEGESVNDLDPNDYCRECFAELTQGVVIQNMELVAPKGRLVPLGRRLRLLRRAGDTFDFSRNTPSDLRALGLARKAKHLARRKRA